MREADVPRPGWHEVLIRMHTTSLNYRDIAIALGNYGAGKVV